MAVLVKRGGRAEYKCEGEGCSNPIEVGTPHFRSGGGPFKRYHEECLPEGMPKEHKVRSPKAEAPETEASEIEAVA